MTEVEYVEGYRSRTEQMTAYLTPSSLKSGTHATTTIRDYARRLGKPNDKAGHILAKSLGGSGTQISNIFPQDPHANLKEWRKAERWIEKCLKQWRSSGDNPQNPLIYKVKLEYPNQSVTRPSKIFWDTYFTPGLQNVYSDGVVGNANSHGVIYNARA